ncbi:glycosyltransferase [Cellulosimicrobium sp. Marseille-Q4280]|uniref:glycosyltransferase n=1 Tax=Cellulosimicrobium sp. Marseille-Q4280 TaxID=2937992 RepID=UPI00203A4ACD|nr:glycosyltransferase [Cellulosimicrobium sp. Marseille-Q4280]
MRVVILPFYHGLGHVVRSTRIATELMARGAEVVVGVAADARRWPEARGVPTATLTELPPLPPVPDDAGSPDVTSSPDGAASPGHRPAPRLRLADEEYLRVALEEERALVRAVGADVVLADFRVTGPVSARLEGVRSATVVNTGFFSFPFPDVVRDVTPALHRLGVPRDVAGRLLGDVVYVPDRSAFEPLADVRDPLSVAALRTVDEIRHVGPVLASDPLTVPDRAQARTLLGLDPHAPVVLVSLGGTAQGFATLRTVAGLLDDVPAHTVLVTGPNVDPALLADHRADRLLQLTDESMLWTRAADLVVTHGGHTSVMEALALGRPLLALPGQDEQRWNAGRAVGLGTGEVLDPADVAPRFVPTVRRLLADDALRRRAEAVGAVLAAHDGARDLAEHVLTSARLAALGPRA